MHRDKRAVAPLLIWTRYEYSFHMRAHTQCTSRRQETSQASPAPSWFSPSLVSSLQPSSFLSHIVLSVSQVPNVLNQALKLCHRVPSTSARTCARHSIRAIRYRIPYLPSFFFFFHRFNIVSFVSSRCHSYNRYSVSPTSSSGPPCYE